MAGVKHISVEAHNKEVEALLTTIEKLAILAAERNNEIEQLNTRVTELERRLTDLLRGGA